MRYVQVQSGGMTRNEGGQVGWKPLPKTLDAELRNATAGPKELSFQKELCHSCACRQYPSLKFDMIDWLDQETDVFAELSKQECWDLCFTSFRKESTTAW